MGLDMYLRKCPKVFRNGEKIKVIDLDPEELLHENYELYEFLEPYEVEAGETFCYQSYSIEVGYWRKANQIHRWFVKNVQDGCDECQHSLVEREQLEELLELCLKVKDSCKLVRGKVFDGIRFNAANGKQETLYTDGMVIEDYSIAEKLLPTQSGFFFGDTGYDQYYLQDINDTIEILEKVLAETDFDKDEIYYRASW